MKEVKRKVALALALTSLVNGVSINRVSAEETVPVSDTGSTTSEPSNNTTINTTTPSAVEVVTETKTSSTGSIEGLTSGQAYKIKLTNLGKTYYSTSNGSVTTNYDNCKSLSEGVTSLTGLPSDEVYTLTEIDEPVVTPVVEPTTPVVEPTTQTVVEPTTPAPPTQTVDTTTLEHLVGIHPWISKIKGDV